MNEGFLLISSYFLFIFVIEENVELRYNIGQAYFYLLIGIIGINILFVIQYLFIELSKKYILN